MVPLPDFCAPSISIIWLLYPFYGQPQSLLPHHNNFFPGSDIAFTGYSFPQLTLDADRASGIQRSHHGATATNHGSQSAHRFPAESSAANAIGDNRVSHKYREQRY